MPDIPWSTFISLIVGSGLTFLIQNYVEKRKIKSGFTQELYRRRLETYSKLIRITQNTGKQTQPLEAYKQCRDALIEWQTNTDGYLLLSRDSLPAFRALKEALKKNPGDGVKYSKVQIVKIWQCRNQLRRALRKDLRLYHNEKEDD